MTGSEYLVATGQVSEHTRRAMRRRTDAAIDAYSERAETGAERRLAEFLRTLRTA